MKRYKLGIFIGKFYPLHMGHLTTLSALANVCDRAYVIFYDSRQGEERIAQKLGFTYAVDSRVRDARNALSKHKNISVIKVSIPDDLAFPNDFKKIKTIVEDTLGNKADVQIFGGEEKDIYLPYKYTDEYMLGPVYEVKDKENKPVSLHATLIREDYDFYKKYLPDDVRKTLDNIRSNNSSNRPKSASVLSE